MSPDLLQWITSTFGADAAFWLRYFTNGKHLTWYASVGYTLTAAVLGGLCALGFGLVGATLRNSSSGTVRLIGAGYTNMVRGVPDVLFFLFFPLAFEQFVELINAQHICTPETLNAAGTWPPCAAANWARHHRIPAACLGVAGHCLRGLHGQCHCGRHARRAARPA